MGNSRYSAAAQSWTELEVRLPGTAEGHSVTLINDICPPQPTTTPPPAPPASPCSRANFEEEGNYFEGDMILPSDVAKNHINNTAKRWPGGIVPFVDEGTFSEKIM